MSTLPEITERFINLYRENTGKIETKSSPYLNSFREEALNRFISLGIPTKKNEAYKYTNLDIFFNHE